MKKYEIFIHNDFFLLFVKKCVSWNSKYKMLRFCYCVKSFPREFDLHESNDFANCKNIDILIKIENSKLICCQISYWDPGSSFRLLVLQKQGKRPGLLGGYWISSIDNVQHYIHIFLASAMLVDQHNFSLFINGSRKQEEKKYELQSFIYHNDLI